MRSSRPTMFAALALLCWLAASRAQAQSHAFNFDHLQLAVTSGEFLGVEGAGTLPAWGWRAGAGYGFSSDALLADTPSGTRPLVGSRSMLNLFGAMALGRWITVGLDVPVLLTQSGDGVADSRGALGDLRFIGRIEAYRSTSFHVAAVVALRAPTGDTTRFLGEGGLVGEPRAVAEWSGGRLAVGLNLGARFRGARQLGDLTVGNELFASAAVSVRPHPAVDGFVELHADTALSGRFLSAPSTPVELLGGVTGRFRGLAATGAVGVGLVDGYGDPKVRLIFTLAYQAPARSLPSLPAPPPRLVAAVAPRPVTLAPPPPPVPHPVEVDPAEPDVQVGDEMVELADPIFFDTNRKRIKSRYNLELTELARAINKRPWIDVLWIDGHADGVGSRPWNFALSELRAEEVRRFLVAHGVAPERLRTLAYGDTHPWFSNAQQEGRAKNRRAVFLIEKRAARPDGVEAPSPTETPR